MFIHRANLQRHVNGGIGCHLQLDAGLDVGRETKLAYFQPVVADRKIGQHVSPICFAVHHSGETCFGLSNRDLSACNRRARRVLNNALYLSRVLRLRPQRNGAQQQYSDGFHGSLPARLATISQTLIDGKGSR